jgi:hypothetical protein
MSELGIFLLCAVLFFFGFMAGIEWAKHYNKE